MRISIKILSALLSLLFILSPAYVSAKDDDGTVYEEEVLPVEDTEDVLCEESSTDDTAVPPAAAGGSEENTVTVEPTHLESPPPDSKYVLSTSFTKAEFVVGSAWTTIPANHDVDHIEGVRLCTNSSSYRLEYRVKPRGYDWTGWENSNATGKYPGKNGVPVTNLEIKVFSSIKNGYDKTDYVVMYRAKAGGTWFGWVSNAPYDVMYRIQNDFSLGGELDAAATDAGWAAYGNISALEIHVFEKRNHKAGSGAVLIDAPYINQYAVSLPNGCESVCAVMALQYADFNTDTETFVKNYLPRGSAPSYGIGSDPSEVYVGDPHHTGDGLGWGCLSSVIVKAFRSALSGKPYIISDLKGKSLSYLCSEYIDRGVPVIVWGTVDMTSDVNYSSWQTPSGKTINYVNQLHCLLLVGYDSNYYYFNDPMTRIGSEKYFAYKKSAVSAAYDLLGKGAVAVERNLCTGITVTPLQSTKYVEDDKIEMETLSVTAHFSDGTETVVTDYVLDPGYAVYGDDSVTVRYNYYWGTVTTSFGVTVYGKLCGDADGDADVTMKDVLRCRRIVAGLEDESTVLFTNADCVKDADINMKDVLFMRRIVAGLD